MCGCGMPGVRVTVPLPPLCSARLPLRSSGSVVPSASRRRAAFCGALSHRPRVAITLGRQAWDIEVTGASAGCGGSRVGERATKNGAREYD